MAREEDRLMRVIGTCVLAFLAYIGAVMGIASVGGVGSFELILLTAVFMFGTVWVLRDRPTAVEE